MISLSSISKGKQIKAPRMIVLGVEKIGKALDISTEIPTPHGWKTMQDIKEGDAVFAGDGSVTRVTGVTGVMNNRNCFAVKFHTGASVIADADHQWSVISINRNKRKVMTTQQMYEHGVMRNGDRYCFAVPMAGSVQMPATELPINPYTLGVWLGDGTSASGGITIADIDSDIFDHVSSDGYAISENITAGGNCKTRTIIGLKVKLRALGVLDNKHIPEAYLNASRMDRWHLLQGLLDTDGHAANTGKGEVEFSSVDEGIALKFTELCLGLGIKARMSVGEARINGRYISPKYRVTFSTSMPVFRTSRKAKTLQERTSKQKAQKNAIIAIDPVDSVPVKCIAVDHPSHTYLVTRQYIVTHNTNFACGTVFEDGKAKEYGTNKPIGIPMKGETGMDDLDIAKFPACQTFAEVLEAIGALATDEHAYKTVVLDSASALGPIIYDDVCAEFNVKNIRKISGFRIGEAAVQQRWRQLLESLDVLRDEKNMAIILIGHIKVRKQKNPEGDDYDCYDFDLDSEVSELLKRWADLILFCNTKVSVKKEGEDTTFSKAKKRGYDLTHGQRFLYTQKRPAHPGGGRGIYGSLAYELPLEWAAFEEAVAELM